MTDDRKLIRAKDATAYDLVGMPDERFELMVSRLVRLEFPRAFKPANTRDGGADMVLPRAEGWGYERCWQSKHFPKAISWDKCKASLAAARQHWEPQRYTFVFPRELTSREQDTFDRHFRGPDADITVDHWNGEELQFRLCSSDQGQRIAFTFFNHAVDDHKRTLQAIEAGGSLDSPDDVLDRVLNIGGSLAGRDDFFTYPGAFHETHEDGPPVTPGTVMSFEKSDGDITSRIDIVPRDEQAMELYGPQFSVRGTDDEAGELAAQRLREALHEGAAVEIQGGLEVTFTRMPPAFADLVGERLSAIGVRVGPAKRVRPEAAPWRARLRAATDEGEASLDLVMRQAEVVPDGWDDAFTAEFGGLTATLLFRRRGTGGELHWNIRYTRNRSPVRQQLAAMTFMKVVSGTGEFVVTSLDRPENPEMRFPAMANPIADDARDILTFLQYIRVIEQWADVELNLPDDISAEDARNVAIVAQLIRNRGRSVTWHNFKANVSSVRPLRDGQLVRVEMETSAKVLGQVVDLGHLRMDFTDYKVVSAEPAPDHPGYFTVRIEPRSPSNARIFEQLAREKTAAKKRPPPPPRRKGNRGRGRKP